YRVFWRQFRQAYHSTGAVLPSGRGLARALTHFVRHCDSVGRRILEVGPGTGAVTVQIINDLRPSDRLVLIERNEQFVGHLRKRFNEAPAADAIDRISLVHASVEELPDDEKYDLIISGLPLN